MVVARHPLHLDPHSAGMGGIASFDSAAGQIKGQRPAPDAGVELNVSAAERWRIGLHVAACFCGCRWTRSMIRWHDGMMTRG